MAAVHFEAMNMLDSQPDERRREQVKCPHCGVGVWVPVRQVLERVEHLEEALSGGFNCGWCAGCGQQVAADVPVHCHLPELGLVHLQYLPFGMLGCGEALDALLLAGGDQNLSLGFDEFQRQLRARLIIERHLASRRVELASVKIPPDVQARIRGAYPKPVLKLLWFITTHFEEGEDYPESEVDAVIRYALRRTGTINPLGDTPRLRAALCELGFLTLPVVGRIYQKLAQPGASSKPAAGGVSRCAPG